MHGELILINPPTIEHLLITKALEQIIEVISPDPIKQNYFCKRSEYAVIAVSEYWTVAPLERQVSLLTWEEGLYEAIVLTGHELLRSQTFPDLNLTVEQILAAGNLPS